MIRKIIKNNNFLLKQSPFKQYSTIPTYINPGHAQLLFKQNPSKVKFIDFRDPNMYKQAHLPNAINNDDQLPSMTDFWRLYNASNSLDILSLRYELGLQELGINKGDIIIGYENSFYLTFNTQLLYYFTKYMGYQQVSILKGGFNGWTKQGYPTQQCKSLDELYKLQEGCQQGDFCSLTEKNNGVFTDKYTLLNQIQQHSDNLKIIDAREPHEYQQGHIPQAVNIPYQTFYQKSKEIGVYVKNQKQIDRILKKYDIHQNDHIVVYCQRGLRGSACFTALQSAGYENCSNYVGSYHEWSNDLSLPIEIC